MYKKNRKKYHVSVKRQKLIQYFFLRFQQILIIKKNWLWICYVCLFLTILLVSQIIPVLANQSISSENNIIVQKTVKPSAILLQQGKNYYQTGKFSQAAKVWQSALQNYQTQGDIIKQIQTLNYLALTYKELGNIKQAQIFIDRSFNLLKSLKKINNQSSLLLGQALNTQGTIQILQGQTETALDTWKQAAQTYEKTGDKTGKLISQINQAQGLQALGQYLHAKKLLEELITQLQKQPDSLIKAQGLRSLGVAMQTLGDLQQSKKTLEQSLTISKQLISPDTVDAVLFSIANVARDLQENEQALKYYQDVVNLSPSILTRIEANLNQLSLLIKLQRWKSASALIPQLETQITQLSSSRPAIYAKINFAASLMKMERVAENGQVFSKFNGAKIAKILAKAIQQARKIQDPRAEAYSLKQLGQLYQEKGQLTAAKTLTEQSLKIAQNINAADLLASTAGQLGVIFKQQGNLDHAIAAYEISFNNLQSLRNDLVAINTEIQFNFKENIEPFYRDFASLLLQKDTQSNLKQARKVIDALRIAELDNYFRDACVDTYPVALEEIDVQAAVIYPIILRDRLEVIISVPNQPLRHYNTQLTQQQIEATLQEIYSSISPIYSSDKRLKLFQQLYNWLLAPAEATLQENDVKTLVFVPDGFLQRLPMAALYDGKQYLVEKYSVVFSPGLQLFPPALQQNKMSVLVAGITQARQGFNPLPGVTTEIKEITNAINSVALIDQEFTRNQFKTIIESQPFPIVHLATHGQFSSNPQETFLLTWSDRISIQDFEGLFQKRRLGIIKPIELLVMSACQTAAGDRRATLGLAGFALRSGAKSTIASLWSVSDESTSSLMAEFYQQLTENKLITKAEALRQAQLKVMKNPSYKHPYYWSSFVIVGNWL